jgi:CheY-like chemotaxis protein
VAKKARGKILVVEHDPGIGDLLVAILVDDGYVVELLGRVATDVIRVAVGRFEPDCVLLDGQDGRGYGSSWGEAAWLSGRSRHVPVVMLTSHVPAFEEAKAELTPRSQDAAFAAVVRKPFDLDELLEAVWTAIGESSPFDESPAAESGRTAVLVAKLREAGARDVRPSNRREWASFRVPDGSLIQLYWWQRDGVYYVVRHADTGGLVERMGRMHDLDTAIALAVAPRPGADGAPPVEGTADP